MPRQLSKSQLALLISALMSTGIGQSLVFAILAPLGREVALREVQITSIIAISALIFGLLSPVWGRLSDRIGRRPVMLIGLLGYTVGNLVFTSVFYLGMQGTLAGTTLFLVLMLARCSQSAIMSATSPAVTAYAADHSSSDQRLRTMARLGTANSLGMILGPAVSGALAVFGLLAPMYFAATLTLSAAMLIWARLPVTPEGQLGKRRPRARLSVFDPRIFLYLATAGGLFLGWSGIQQTIGFRLQDQLQLSGIETAQYTGAALMVAALATLLMQVTVMQRLNLRATQFAKIGVLSMLCGAGLLSMASSFSWILGAMAFFGAGLGVTMPAISSAASLAVRPEEQGGTAGLVAACPALGFTVGPIVAGFLYQIDGSLAPLFSATVFFLVLVMLAMTGRRRRGGL